MAIGLVPSRRSAPPTRCRLGAGSDEDVASVQGVVAHLESRPIEKMCATVEHCDTGLGVLFLSVFRNWISKGFLKTHERWPIDLRIRQRNSVTFHPAKPVDQIRSANQNFLGIATA